MTFLISFAVLLIVNNCGRKLSYSDYFCVQVAKS